MKRWILAAAVALGCSGTAFARGAMSAQTGSTNNPNAVGANAATPTATPTVTGPEAGQGPGAPGANNGQSNVSGDTGMTGGQDVPPTGTDVSGSNAGIGASGTQADTSQNPAKATEAAKKKERELQQQKQQDQSK